MRISGIKNQSTIDGHGLNMVIYVQGCNHNCKGCHNPSTHSPDGGYELREEEILQAIDDNKMITGVTISGGEPLDQHLCVTSLARRIKEKGLRLTLYTGYNLTLKENRILIPKLNYNELLVSKDLFDYIIDGNFILEKKTTTVPFVGSSNQRVLKKGRDY